ncbi:MAG: hypothetical protein CVU89_16780 [Firmicutes bacterium HGW-Firmicutes-14]|nr:MAG: hypothetical protein CVU89_16780 [Firmicutes bacterium HGW-Firmicutes-14]
MLKGREIISLPVVTSGERKQLGEVRDIIYDPYENRILGYIMENSGWIRDGRGFLHCDMVKREDDCIIVQDESAIRKLGTMPELKEALKEGKDIRGLRVEDSEGKYVGTIQDLIINEETGDISGYEVSDGVIQDLLHGRSMIPNADIIIDSGRVVACAGDRCDEVL